MKTVKVSVSAVACLAAACMLVQPLLAEEKVGKPLANFDIRMQASPDQSTQSLMKGVSGAAVKSRLKSQASAMANAEADVSSRIAGLEVTRSSLTGGPELVAAAGFLTEPAPGQTGEQIVRKFYQDNQNLFGLAQADLDQLHFLGESKSPSGLRTVRVEQRIDGIPVFQSETRVTLSADGRVFRVVGALVPNATASVKPTENPVSAAEALEAAMASVAVEVDSAAMSLTATSADGNKTEVVPNDTDMSGNVVSHKVYFLSGPATLTLGWSQVAYTTSGGAWYSVVDAGGAGLMWRKNIKAHASTHEARFSVYVQADGSTPADSPAPLSPTNVVPGSGTQPSGIARTTVNMLTVQSATASPDGWIADGGTTTLGNNVHAYMDAFAGANNNLPDTTPQFVLDGAGKPTGNPDANVRNRDFLGTSPRDFLGGFNPPPLAGDPEAGQTATGNGNNGTLAIDSFRRGSVTQAFYVTNWYHDRMHGLGFDQAAGNFQTDNFGGGGVGGDAVLAETQDNSSTNNANFATPPDGQPGRMQMFRFTGPTIDRDSNLDSEIVIHELSHGLSNRLIGNGAGLNWEIGKSMGEGWSDFYALSLLNNTNADDPNGKYASGGYATFKLGGLLDNHLYGIRRFPYSTDNAVNPLTWADVDQTTNDMSGGIPANPLNFNASGALEVHNAGEVWCLTLWEVRSRIIADPAGANGSVPAGNQTTLQLVTDGMKLTPATPSFVEARDAILAADLAANASANEQSIWAGFADRGLGYNALAPNKYQFAFTSGHMGVKESFDLPYLDVQSVTVNDAIGNGNGALDPNEPSQLVVQLKNPWRQASKGVVSATAVLTSSTPGVVITNGNSTYGAIAALGSASGSPFQITVPAGATAGQSLNFTITVTSTLGTKAVDFKVRVGTPGGAGAPVTLTRTIPGGLAIPDNSPGGVIDTFNVPADMDIMDLDFRVDSLTHTFTGDVTVMLRGPSGYGAELISVIGGGTGGGSGDNMINMVIDDQSPNGNLLSVPNSAAPYTGTWKPIFNQPEWSSFGFGPADPIGQLSLFNGGSSQGDWKVVVSDQAGTDLGTLNAWSLIITPRTYSVTAFVAPEIAVYDGNGTGGAQRTDNTGTAAFGSVNVGSSSAAQIFTIQNSGTATVNLTGLVVSSTSAEFSVTQPGSSSLAPGATTTFTVTFSPTSGGAKTGAINIASNDDDENPFEIQVSGTGAAAAPLFIQAAPSSNNGSGGVFTQLTAGVTPLSFQGFSTIFTSSAGTGVQVQVWTRSSGYAGFTAASTGWTLWETVSGLSAGSTVESQPFLLTTPIPVPASGVVSVYMHAITTGGGIRYNGTSGEPPVTSYSDANLTLFTDTARTGNIAFGTSQNSPRAFAGKLYYSLGAVAPAPEIAVFNGASTAPVNARTDNTGSHAFGSVNTGSSSAAQTFTIQNTGTANLTLGTVTLTGTDPGQFSVTQPLSTTLIANATTTFTVTFSPTTAGAKSAVVNIASNDADENPFEVNVGGTGVLAPGLPIYDNGPLVTHPGGGAGGANASRLQNTSLGMGNFGFTANGTFRLADDFTIPAGQTWTITRLEVFGYQTGSTTTSSFTGLNFRIWNGSPNAGGAIIFGDTSTNRLTGSTFSNIYRDLETAVGDNQRPIMTLDGNVGSLVLGPGTYFVDWAASGSIASGPFFPPITINGQNTTGNALQFNPTWAGVVDPGAGLPPQGMPFKLYGSVTTSGAPVFTGVPITTQGTDYLATGQNLPTRELADFVPADGQEYTYLEITNAADDIIGFFNDLPQGGVVAMNLNGVIYYFQANYNGGVDGNDLVLTNFTPGTAMWKWLAGPSSRNGVGIYGNINVAAPTNNPGARQGAMNWLGQDGSLWMLGGYGYATSVTNPPRYLNDLWQYDRTIGRWIWRKGNNTPNNFGDYGAITVETAANNPGSRHTGTTWTDANGNLWLFGGFGVGTGVGAASLNDLWRFNRTTGNWTWMKGSTVTGAAAVRGALGAADPAYTPGARSSAAGVFSNGFLWLFGGYTGASYYNDIWRYEIATGNWAWMGGSSTPNQNGAYGSQGAGSTANIPGARRDATAWLAKDGTIWFFGGLGLPATGADAGDLNDLWRYNPANGEWTWMKGSNTTGAAGVYGTVNTPAPNNTPGARSAGSGWVTVDGDFWLVGGFKDSFLTFNDVWIYDVPTNQWVWKQGTEGTLSVPGVYGTQGEAAAGNQPGGRFTPSTWVTINGSLWIFGGGGADSFGNTGRMSDLWSYAIPPRPGAPYDNEFPAAFPNNLIVNADPSASDATAGTMAYVPVSGQLSGLDTDGDRLLFSAAGATTLSQGTLTLNVDGTWTYTPANGFTGVAAFHFQAADNYGGQSAVKTLVITVISNPADSDGDGIADSYEQSMWGSLAAADGDGDADLDGQSNYFEFLAGTSPLDGGARLDTAPMVSGVGSDTGSVQLQLNHVRPGVNYHLETSADLEAWDRIGTFTFDVSGSATIEAPALPTVAPQFYRVSLEATSAVLLP